MLRVFLLALIAVFAAACSSSAPIIGHLTITNPTVYDLEVRARSAKDNDWIPLGRVPRGQTSTAEQVDDLGQEWVFRFEYPGPILGGDLRLSREQLVRSSWKVTVPETVEQRLRNAHVSPSQR